MPAAVSTSPVGLGIVATGAATSLGGFAGACAAARAGLGRPRPLEGFGVYDPDGGGLEPAIGHPVSFLTDGFGGMARLARVAALALQDLVRGGGIRPDELSETAVVLALGSGYYLDALAALEESDDPAAPLGRACPPPSEASDDLRAAIEADLIDRAFELARLPAPGERGLLFDDHAAGSLALRWARDALATGRARRCLVLAVDSLCDPASLEAVHGLDLLKTPENATGMVPGEAAIVLLVDLGRARAGSGRCVIDAVAHARDGEHLLSPDAHACRRLADTIAAVAPGGDPPSWTLGSHNGTALAASEWGRALRNLPRPLADGVHWYPATSFGETGAASSLLAACLAARAIERRYAPGSRALIWSSAPGGSKAAFTMRGE